MRPQDRARHLRPYIVKGSASLSDTEALQAIELFQHWDGNGHSYETDDRFRFDNRLYKVRQAHTSQPQYTPDITPALYTEVALPDAGTHDNPIQYNNNMELEEGKYYIQAEVLYLCTMSTGIPVYNDLKDLVGLYVEVAV
jgi:hypothetical protein